MNVALLERRFGRIGARVKVGETHARVGPRVEVGRDDEGEYFDIRVAHRATRSAGDASRIGRRLARIKSRLRRCAADGHNF